jgi:hypothetical protein
MRDECVCAWPWKLAFFFVTAIAHIINVENFWATYYYTLASICLPSLSLYTFLLLSVAFSQLRTRKVKKVSYFYYFLFLSIFL